MKVCRVFRCAKRAAPRVNGRRRGDKPQRCVTAGNLAWGEGEDVLWSKQIREKYEFNINVNSSVFILKGVKDKVFDEPNNDKINVLIKWSN